ncbi:MAG TPA: CHASE domain-containing protein [Verrucomicrobiae bacterium]|nr:CHASE domain-containing protein [Verrucomicrobiae bacterium]
MNPDASPLTTPGDPADARVTPSPRALGRFAHSLAWIVLAISLAASAGGWLIARKHENLTAHKRFDEEVSRIQMALSERMSVYDDVLHGGAGLYAASSSVERSEWKAYVDSVMANRRFPGMDGLGFIACVPRAKLDAFLQTTRADKTPDFQLKNPGTNADFFITKYLEPEMNHAALLGIDVGADPERRAAAEKARDTRLPVISGRLSFMGPGSETQGGLVMLLPVFRNGAPADTLAERRAGIEGWVYARFITARLMGDILKDKESLLRFEVFDRLGQAQQTLVFDSDPPAGNQRNTRPPRFSTVNPLEVGQHLWLLRYSTKPAFNAAIPRSSEMFVAAGGGVISLLLFAIALSMSATRVRAMAMASEMTVAFRNANAGLQKEILDRQRGERRAAIQHAVTRVLADADTLAEATPKIVQAICEHLDWDMGAIWRTNPESKQIQCVEFWHRPGLDVTDFATATRQKMFRPGEGLPGRVWATTQPVWIDDVTRDKNFPRGPVAIAAGLHSAFAFPILMGGKFLGVIEFFSHEILEPDAEVLQLVAALGSQIGQFIERKRAQQELRHEQFLLRMLMDNLPDRIYFKDAQSRFLRNSRAHLQWFGLEQASDAIGKSDFDFFSEEHARQAFEDEQQLMHGGQPMTKEEKETWPDGSVSWALSTKMPLRDEAGKVVGTFGISHDITDRKRAEEVMRQARDEAEEASRTKSQFLANMSHELRTPLNSVIGFAGILLKNKANNLHPSDINFLERIQANGKNLLVLINEILDLSKIEARKVELKMAPVALDVLVRETIAQQEGLVRDPPVQLLAEIPATVAPIQADADKVRQVIINLIGNALKFTERGSVTVRVVTDPANHQPVRIEVIDTGIGIPKDKLGVIFQAFQQADASTARKYGGTGLGLTISQALCQLMGCRIEVASEVGHGSTFSVMLNGKKAGGAPLPAGELAVMTSANIPAAQKPSDLHGKLVLVIDDESDSRVLLTHMLEEFGCQVIAANSGEQGLRMAREFRPQLITVDLLMPQMDGAGVIREIKADPQLRAIPVVVVSIVAEERRGSILGAVDILEKPVAREELLAALERSLLPKRAKILIVDDEEDSRRILLAHLADEPVEVQTAANGRAALAVLETFPPDLVLLDLIMPVMDGMVFLDTIRNDPRYQHLKVVIVTSKELNDSEKERLRRQTLEIVRKTELSEDHFKQLLQRVLKTQAVDEGRKPAATG